MKLKRFNESNQKIPSPKSFLKPKKIDVKFDVCISASYLIDFIAINTGWNWNDICDMEYKYRHSDRFDNIEFFPLVNYGEDDENSFQYWVDKFVETYKEEVGGKTIYVLEDE